VTNFSTNDTALRLDQLPQDPLLRLAFIIVAGTAQKPDAQSANLAAAENAKRLGKRLKLSRQQLDVILRLAAHHRMPDELLEAVSASGLRRYAALIGRSELLSVLNFQRACLGPSPDGSSPQGSLLLDQLGAKLLTEARPEVALNLAELKIGGQDLIKLGVPKGPQLGQILKRLLERVLDDPSLNTEAQLLALAQMELVSIEQ
jgi:tRNA nucleotidyltransferase (CCA-adding enzyme)